MGTADLKAQFGSRRHELTVSTFQAVILLLFNAADRCGGRAALARNTPAPPLRRPNSAPNPQPPPLALDSC
jgi:hypothetical protein